MVVSGEKSISAEQLAQDSSLPITLRQINGLPENAQRRIYRNLLPPRLVGSFSIDPITWKDLEGNTLVYLETKAESGKMDLSVRTSPKEEDDFIFIGLADNSFNGIDLELLVLSDPNAPRFQTDRDEIGKPTHFGTARRNLVEEERAMRAGLAPGQVRRGLGGSRLVLGNLDTFMTALGHRAYFLEPLTYVSAWLFERRGFAYVRGHKLMDDIQQGFQPGGCLHNALDGSSPFRQPELWRTVRGRAWAIQDGILEVMEARWDGLRMVKQVGRDAGVETFPDAIY
jgi:hypothetical protein